MREATKIEILLMGICFLIGLNFFVWQEVFSLDGNLQVVFLDVGQGDSAFIETSQGSQILIDGGPNQNKVLEELAKQTPFWDRSIDLVILTHPEYDHLNGLLGILARYKVANVLWNGVLTTKTLSQDWQKALAGEGAKIIIAQQGQKVKIGETNLLVLNPKEDLAGKTMDSGLNETSVVVKLSYDRIDFLFTGDIAKKTENLLAGECPAIGDCFLQSEVLKVGHHGSKTSTNQLFLEKVMPQMAVISVGENNLYGHPNSETLQRLREFGIKVVRTDELGNIKISSDGQNIF